MRTKNLLLSAAALVAGALSVQAQSNVYSVNVVGYVNQPLAAGKFSLIANPLNAGTNNLTTILSGIPNGSQVQVWTGSGYQLATKGLINGVWSTNLNIAPGEGFFVKPSANYTNTFVGSLVIGFGQTNSVNLPGGVFTLAASPLPFSGRLTDVGTNVLNLNTLPNGSQVQVWNGSGYQLATKGLINGQWNTNLLIQVGQGFFVKPSSAATWSQTLQ
ncbi:MAG TPA: hypothetical protein VFW05_01060 [Verrucomicrobiae bacterium]|nr:hypothetical protein [Verrucomicrobiae bacterium]